MKRQKRATAPIAYRIIEPEGPEQPALKIGTLVMIRAANWDVCTRNDVGGTAQVPNGLYLVRITKEWFDYETGQHYHGAVTEPRDVERIAKATATPFDPKSKEYDPSIVFFYDSAIVEVAK